MKSENIISVLLLSVLLIFKLIQKAALVNLQSFLNFLKITKISKITLSILPRALMFPKN